MKLGSLTPDETVKAIEALTDLLELLGWKVLEPPDKNDVIGLVIGTPDYIDAWIEARKKRKGHFQ
jgi:hypothetical protein